MRRSRLRSHLKQQSLHSIFLTVGGIIVVIILLATFGMDFLVNFSLLVRRTGGDNFKKNNLTYVAPPILNPLSEATKSAAIIVSGYAQDKQTVKLYVNGKLAGKTEVKKDKQFVFESVELEKGANEIKAKAVTEDNKESNYSAPVSISYIDNPPFLEINSPQDGQTVPKEPLKVTGKTDAGVKVTINDFWAITEDDGSFSYTLSLHDGENIIRVTATDDAGNQTTKEIKVTAS